MVRNSLQPIGAGKVMKKVAIFTDLDGTLLDHQTYSFNEAKPALAKIIETKTPLVFVTSKTLAEVEVIQREMGIWGRDPFIVENGGALFIPKKLLNFELQAELPDKRVLEKERFWQIEFGSSYQQVRAVLKEAVQETRIPIRAIGDMTVEEFAKETGLTKEMAERAKQRRYQEGFKILVPPEQQKESQERIREAIEKRGFFMSIGGRFYQIMSEKAKVKAVKTLMKLFRKKYGQIYTIGLGDAQADLEFIELCDEGYLIKNPQKAIGGEVESDKLHYVKEGGPAGWNKVVINRLAKVFSKN